MARQRLTMKTFVVFLDTVERFGFFGRTRTVTKRVEIDALDIVMASALARFQNGGEVSMIWPKV